jgi:hypothetical protein
MRGGRKKKKFLGFQESGCFFVLYRWEVFVGWYRSWVGPEIQIGLKF